MPKAAFLALCLALVPSAAFAQQTDIDPRVAQLVAGVSEERLTALLNRLVTFETRFTQ